MTKRNCYVWTMRLLMWLAVGITAALTLFVVGYVLVKGIPHLSWEFVSTKPSYLSGSIGILPDILNTVYIVIATLVIDLKLPVSLFLLHVFSLIPRICIRLQYQHLRSCNP